MMSMEPELASAALRPPPMRSFRRTLLRGLGVLLPPVLTVVIFIWAWNTIHLYLLAPLTTMTRDTAAWAAAEVRYDLEGERPLADGRVWAQLPNQSYVPAEVYDVVRAESGGQPRPATGLEVYQQYITVRFLKPHFVVPVFLLVFIVTMYLLGRFLAAGMGRFVWGQLERGIEHLPLVRRVYSAVKQVTDYMVSENKLQFKRIVAVEYPRKGTWALGFVTSEGLPDIRAVAGEPVVTVLISNSPWTISGWIITVLKSETIDLNMTADQAVQFIMSCGVVLPQTHPAGHKRPEERSRAAAAQA